MSRWCQVRGASVLNGGRKASVSPEGAIALTKNWCPSPLALWHPAGESGPMMGPSFTVIKVTAGQFTVSRKQDGSESSKMSVGRHGAIKNS